MKNLFVTFEDTRVKRIITIVSAAAVLLLFLTALPYYSAKTQLDRFSSTLLQTVGETGEMEESTTRLLEEFHARNGWQPRVNWFCADAAGSSKSVTLEVIGEPDLEFWGGLFQTPMVIASRTTGTWEWVAG